MENTGAKGSHPAGLEGAVYDRPRAHPARKLTTGHSPEPEAYRKTKSIPGSLPVRTLDPRGVEPGASRRAYYCPADPARCAATRHRPEQNLASLRRGVNAWPHLAHIVVGFGFARHSSHSVSYSI